MLAPVFFADPAGAVVGKYCSHTCPEYNKKWHDKKTIAGSAAVLGFTYATIAFPCTWCARQVDHECHKGVSDNFWLH